MQGRASERSSCTGSFTRAWNIALRATHISVTGVLVGGHVFGIAPGRLIPWVYMAIITGLVLMLIEAYPDWRYFSEGRGVMVLAKVSLLCTIPWFWQERVAILAAILIMASIGSHMPKRYRHYSLIERRVIEK